MVDTNTKPVTATVKTGVVIHGAGKIVNYDTTGIDLTGANEIALAITASDSSRTAAGVLDTAAGATCSVYPLGGVLMVQNVAGETYTFGDLVYAQASGLAGKTSSSRKLLGIYVGAGVTTAALGANGAGDTTNTEGTLIPVATAGAATA
tara:strand:+ start:539 stop:985 length:447 start_codon:yes stop_codon:yes gene_type:complete